MQNKKPDYLNVSPVGSVRIDDPFWNRYLANIQETMIPHMYAKCTEGDALYLTKMAAGDIPFEPLPEDGNIRGKHGDITLVGWLEGALFSLLHKPNRQIEEWTEYIIDLFVRGQAEDGYMIPWYNLYEPEKKLKGLLQSHETVLLADHLDSSIVHYQLTGKRNYLDAVCRLCDFLYDRIGPNGEEPDVYDGHAGIEPALVKLYRVTGEKKYLELAKHLIDIRGVDPTALQRQWERNGNESMYADWDTFADNKYMQFHKPVREQDTAEGHAVRALYLYTGMIDVYMETGDETLLEACKVLYNNIANKRMYISGGVGSCCSGERFTADYDLPNGTMYCESCANVAMTFFCRRMFQATRDAKYLDTLELELYNAVPAGTSLDGRHFFYVNPLEVWPTASETDITKRHVEPERWEWTRVSCCPPNLQSALTGLDGYLYYSGGDVLYAGLFVSGETVQDVGGRQVGVKVETSYPFGSTVTFTIDYDGAFTFAVRKPGWAEKVSLSVNGAPVEAENVGGMLHIRRSWKPGDVVEYVLDMPARLVVSHPRVRANARRGAIMRGPMLYCLEEIDNGENLSALAIPRNVKFEERYEPELLGGTMTLRFRGTRLLEDDWSEEELYKPFVMKEEEAELVAIPYCLWQNRGKGELQTWLPLQ